MVRNLIATCALSLALGLSAPAAGAVLPFNYTLLITMGNLTPINITGSGVGVSNGAGAAATMPAGVISTAVATGISPPLVIVNGLAIGAQGLPGGGSGQLFNTVTPTHPPGVNSQFNWNGTGGTMPFAASAYLLFITAPPIGLALPTAIPLSVVGVGGTVAVGGLVASVIGNPFQLSTTTVTGAYNGTTTAQTATGFDTRTAGGVGQLQVVSPTRVNLGGILAGQYVGVISQLTIDFLPVPEPGALILLGTGLAGLAFGGLRRR
jgi:hypothetical protein